MKILVTGGLGFIGSNFIIDQIKKHNNLILNYDKITYAANKNNLTIIEDSPNYNFIKGDINNSKDFNLCLKNFKPDFIINFAAESHVDRSIDGPREFINTNIIGTYELLNVVLKFYNNLSSNEKKRFKFLHVSTDEVYGSLNNVGYFTEQTPYAPSSPYSASKASSDHLVKAWVHTYGLPAVITNCSNNYGPYQFPEKLIPLMIINCLKEKPLPIYGTGCNIRDWLHVQDHCDALYSVLLNGVAGETYNIGGNQEKSNIEIVKNICSILDSKISPNSCNSYSNLITYVEDRPGHDFRYAIDASKIKNDLGWEPKYNFNNGINETIDWYINNKEWWVKILNEKYNLKRLGEV